VYQIKFDAQFFSLLSSASKKRRIITAQREGDQLVPRTHPYDSDKLLSLDAVGAAIAPPELPQMN
jgi:hypothetical protein